MKTILLVAIATLGLAGCGSMDFFGDSSSAQEQPTAAPDAQMSATPTPAPLSAEASAPMAAPAASESSMPSAAPAQSETVAAAQTAPDDQAPMAQPVPAPVAQASTSPNAHCIALAKQRAIDSAYQGEDGDTQESVYNRTYSDCVAWDLKHAFR